MSGITVKYFKLTRDYSFQNSSSAVDTAQSYELELDDLDNKIHDYLIKITQVGVEKEESNIPCNDDYTGMYGSNCINSQDE